jgi:hypothetical protein
LKKVLKYAEIAVKGNPNDAKIKEFYDMVAG